MKKDIIIKQIIGVIFVGILGVLLHFAYEWSGENRIVAIFSGVNESTWEHMKLLFFSMLIFALIEKRWLATEPLNFWCIKLRGIITGLISIPIIFYTTNGVLGKTHDWFNILIFFISAALAFIYETKLFLENKTCRFRGAAKLTLLVIALLFALFTFFPPPINLFRDPLTKLYGI